VNCCEVVSEYCCVVLACGVQSLKSTRFFQIFSIVGDSSRKVKFFTCPKSSVIDVPILFVFRDVRLCWSLGRERFKLEFG